MNLLHHHHPTIRPSSQERQRQVSMATQSPSTNRAVFLQTDYYYQYTECDSTGSRWRVAIPLSPGSCSELPPPSRGTDCCECRPSPGVSRCVQVCPQQTDPAFPCSVLLPSGEVLGDVLAAVHPLRRRLLLSGQRPAVRPVGRRPCRLHQPGQLPGPRAERRGRSGL